MAIWQPREEGGLKLPPLVKPEGAGYMPLYCAAQWIATRGGTVDIDPSDLSAWQDAFEKLLAGIASEQVTVTGICDGERKKLEGHLFAGIRVDYPFHDMPFELLTSEEPYLSSRVYIDEAQWHKDSNDSLETLRGCEWSKLMVVRSHVAQLFNVEGTAAMARHTGAPGRPSSMHLVDAEHRARWDRGEAEPSIGAEAIILSKWLKFKHPNAPPLKPKSIANRLRQEHRKRTDEARK
jgi:hypothetical protein